MKPMQKDVAKTYLIKRIMDDVYGISSSGVMCWLFVGKTGALLIDTAYGFTDLKNAVESVTDLPLTVLNSHGHVDHSGGNFFFDTPVCIHEADVEVYKRHNTPEFHRLMEETLKAFNAIFFWRTLVPKHPEEHDADRMAFDNWHFLREGDAFDLGGMTARVVEIPGHTRGSVAVYVPEKRLLVTTDGANPATWLFLPESTTLSTYRESLKKLAAYDFDVILTGHSLQLYGRKDLESWQNVAEHPGMAHARAEANKVAPGVEILHLWAADDPKHKGPSILVDRNKIG